MIKNIFWSVDGTLFDTYPAITYALSRSMNELGLPVALNVIDGLVRKSLERCVASLSERFNVDPDRLRQQFEAHYRQLALANQAPFPGVRDVCADIRSLGGLNIIVTQRNQATVQQLLAAHGLEPLFTGIYSLEQDYAYEPVAAMFANILNELGLNRESSLVVSSRGLDIRAGAETGLRTCLFGRAALSEPADYRIESYNQLLALLQEMPA